LAYWKSASLSACLLDSLDRRVANLLTMRSMGSRGQVKEQHNVPFQNKFHVLLYDKLTCITILISSNRLRNDNRNPLDSKHFITVACKANDYPALWCTKSNSFALIQVTGIAKDLSSHLVRLKEYIHKSEDPSSASIAPFKYSRFREKGRSKSYTSTKLQALALGGPMLVLEYYTWEYEVQIWRALGSLNLQRKEETTPEKKRTSDSRVRWGLNRVYKTHSSVAILTSTSKIESFYYKEGGTRLFPVWKDTWYASYEGLYFSFRIHLTRPEVPRTTWVCDSKAELDSNSLQGNELDISRLGKCTLTARTNRLSRIEGNWFPEAQRPFHEIFVVVAILNFLMRISKISSVGEKIYCDCELGSSKTWTNPPKIAQYSLTVASFRSTRQGSISTSILEICQMAIVDQCVKNYN
jgi:hypothetical protein